MEKKSVNADDLDNESEKKCEKIKASRCPRHLIDRS